MSGASSLSCYNFRLLLPIGIPLVPIFALRSHTLESLALLGPLTVGHQRCYREMACCTTQHWFTAYSLPTLTLRQRFSGVPFFREGLWFECEGGKLKRKVSSQRTRAHITQDSALLMVGPPLVRVSYYLRRGRSAPHPCELFSYQYCRSILTTGNFQPPHRLPCFCSNPRDHLSAITYHAAAYSLDRDSQHWMQTCVHVHTARVCGGLLCNRLSRCGQPQNCTEVGLGGGFCWWLCTASSRAQQSPL